MPRGLGSSVQGFVNKWVNANRESVVYGDEGNYNQQVIVLPEEETGARPKSTLRKTSKTKSSGRRRHSQLDDPSKERMIVGPGPYGYDDDKSITSCRTTITTSTHSSHSTRRSVASAASLQSHSPAPGDDDASASSYSKRLKLSNGGAAGALLPPPEVPGVYFGVDYNCRGSMASPPPSVPEDVPSDMAEQPPADVPGVYYGFEYGGSAVPLAPSPSPALEQPSAPAILPPPPGLVVLNSDKRRPNMPMPPRPTMQMDHRVYYPPAPSSSAEMGTSVQHTPPHRPSSCPPQEVMTLCHPQSIGPPASPQLLSRHPPGTDLSDHARPVAPPPVMHFIHQHPPASPIPAVSSRAQMDTDQNVNNRVPRVKNTLHMVKEEDIRRNKPKPPRITSAEPAIEADTVESSSEVGRNITTDEVISSPKSDTSEIEAKMDAALVLSTLSFSDQGPSEAKPASALKGKKGLLLRKSRSPMDGMRNSPGSMISWKARRAARAADNEI